MDTLALLLSSRTPPPFIYIHHPHHPTTSLEWPASTNGCRVDAIECNTPKTIWSAIISRLEGGDAGLMDSMDTFLRRLRLISRARGSVQNSTSKTSKVNGSARAKGKGKELESGLGNGHSNMDERGMCVVITKAERLPRVFGQNWTVMTRLAELAGIPMSVVMVSSVPWDELRAPRGDALEPVHLYLAQSTKDEIVRTLLPSSSHPLYPRFLDLILSTLLPLTSLPSEIDYLSSALWPIYTSSLPPHLEQTSLGRPLHDPTNPPPPLAITMKLLTDLKHQLTLPLTAAIEDVLTRQIGRSDFTSAMLAPASDTGRTRRLVPKAPGLEVSMIEKYLLVAGYCASYNPAKSDLRLFGRGTGPEGRRKKGGGTRRAGYGRVRIGKVPQKLQGPKPFPLDRLLAIFASLYAEHAPRPAHLLPTAEDDQSDDSHSSEDEPGLGEYLTIAEQAARAEKRGKKDGLKDDMWDEEVEHLTMSIKLWSLIPELESQGLLKRVSPPDRLDNVMLRCELDYESVTGLAKELRLTLDDYIYEAIS